MKRKRKDKAGEGDLWIRSTAFGIRSGLVVVVDLFCFLASNVEMWICCLARIRDPNPSVRGREFPTALVILLAEVRG